MIVSPKLLQLVMLTRLQVSRVLGFLLVRFSSKGKTVPLGSVRDLIVVR